MFRQYDETPPERTPGAPPKGLRELLRTMSGGRLLVVGAPLLCSGIVLQVLSASESLACRTSATTSCVVTRHVVFGLLPIGRDEIVDVRGARVVAGNRHRSPDRRVYHVTLDAADGEHSMRGTRSFEAADALVRAVAEAIRTKAGRFEGSTGFVLFDAFARVVTLFMTLVAGGLTGFGLRRLVSKPRLP